MALVCGWERLQAFFALKNMNSAFVDVLNSTYPTKDAAEMMFFIVFVFSKIWHPNSITLTRGLMDDFDDAENRL